jgi:hypothetical protein
MFRGVPWITVNRENNSASMSDENETDTESIHHDEIQTRPPETFVLMNPLLPATRTGQIRHFKCDRWGNPDVNVMFECGAILFDAVLDAPVGCRVFVDKHVVTFQSIRDGDRDNYKQFSDVKVYVLAKIPYPTDFLAVGVIVRAAQFSLVLNGVVIDFVDRKGGHVKLRQSLVDPKKLPREMKLKVAPLSIAAGHYLRAILSTVMYDSPKPMTYRNCHILANKIIRDLSMYTLALVVETSYVPGEPFYKTMKVARRDGEGHLWKKYKW